MKTRQILLIIAVLISFVAALLGSMPVFLGMLLPDGAGLIAAYGAFQMVYLGVSLVFLLLALGLSLKQEPVAPEAATITDQPGSKPPRWPQTLTWIVSPFIVLLLLVPVYGQLRSAESVVEEEQAIHTETVVLAVQGMTCDGCAAHIKETLQAMEGVENADVTFESRKAVVTFQPDKVNPDNLTKAVVEIGYEATPLTRQPAVVDSV